jgi:phosphoribosyl-AMP cyclohydrolase
LPFDVDLLKYNADGLIPAIIQDHDTGAVLMMAYMNREAVSRTLAGRETWFWSRSRQKLWHKGETSGNTQKVTGIFFDCDRDTLLIKVLQRGAACHEGFFTCFHNLIDESGGISTEGTRIFNPTEVYGKK